MITVQTIRYTADPTGWHRLARALGLTPPFEPSPEWAEFDGDGILAIHAADPDAPARGDDLHLLADDLDRLENAAAAQGCEVVRAPMAGVGEVLTITTSSGQRLTASAGARTAHGILAVQPLWYEEDGIPVRQLLRALGLQARITSDAGTWADFTADGGGAVAFHTGPGPRIALAMEYRGDIEQFADRLRREGHDAVVVDEAYNRTLLVGTPDGDRLWINGAMEDLHGYHREDEDT